MFITHVQLILPELHCARCTTRVATLDDAGRVVEPAYIVLSVYAATQGPDDPLDFLCDRCARASDDPADLAPIALHPLHVPRRLPGGPTFIEYALSSGLLLQIGAVDLIADLILSARATGLRLAGGDTGARWAHPAPQTPGGNARDDPS